MDNDDEIEQLIMDHMHIVRAIQRRDFPGSSYQDDLVSEGYLALIQCARKFEPDRGFKFNTYVSYRIRGAMKDYLRGKRFTINDEEWNSYNVILTDKEWILDIEEYHFEPDLINEMFGEYVATKLLPQGREMEMVWAWAVDGERMKAIGKRFGVTESRVSQLVKEKLLALRESFSDEMVAEIRS